MTPASTSDTRNTVRDTMSSTSTRYTATQPPRRASKQKLKLSCDTCASLKVACPKQQPECERCLSKGRRCTYSLACRNGKLKRSKPREPAESLQSPSERLIYPTPTSLAPAENDEYFTSRDSAMNNNITVSGLPEAATIDSSGLRSSLNDGLSFTTLNLQQALWQAAADQPIASVEPNDSFSLTHPYQEASMYHCSDNYFPSYIQPSNWPRQATSPLFTSSPSYVREASDDSTPPSGSTWSYSPATDFEATLSVNNELPRLHPQPKDNCFTRTYILLHTLMQPSSNTCIFESTDMPSPLSWNSFSESIDQILLKTDKAIEHVDSVMQCSCCSTSSVRRALILVIFEVISWYETIVRDINQPQMEKTTSESSSWSSNDGTYVGGTTSLRARSASTGSSLSITGPVPIVSIGDMQLHRADVKSVLVCLVLSRIRKAREIVQHLSMDCSMSLGGVDRLDSVTDECLKLQKEENGL